ncbi:MAG: gliding motility-associated C-terminal domain-containing protein [Brumimicrobium sp.]
MHKIWFIFILTLFIGTSVNSLSQGVLGGDITWKCQGNGDYIFQLRLFQECNVANTTNPKTLSVWGHTTTTSIPVNYVGKTNLTPICTASSGNLPLDCASGGNGTMEEVIYQSVPISITGIPPSGGWKITYQNTQRSASITNLQNPSSHGFTISATIFSIPTSSSSGCIDNSPLFLQSPYVINCSGSEMFFNSNAVDEDLDSLVYRWGIPLDNFTVGSFNPPTNPVEVPFENGYSFLNPMPNSIFDANNQAASLNSESGEITFQSFTNGVFTTKVIVDSYRNGIKNASVEREMVFIVADCIGNNNVPTVTPPFAGNTSFETTVTAGDLVSFSLTTNDLDLLQDGSPQTVSIEASGLMFGTNFTDPTTGCGTIPCATLDTPSPISGTSGATYQFEWQTSCDHLLDVNGEALYSVPYYFVFKVKDDYCPIPGIKYVTVIVNVENKAVLPAPEITCVTTEDNGDITVSWNPIIDNFGTFTAYEIFGVNNGSFGTTANITDNSFSIVGGLVAQEEIYVSILSGCNGNTKKNSEILSNIFLEINNPGNGEAELNWNKPSSDNSNYSEIYVIYKEFPTGTWTAIASVPYNTTNYSDTITVCSEFINYRIEIESTNCTVKSNIDGDVFEDKIVPDIPVIDNVNIDTLTGNITLTWNENNQEDTYGYVIYQTDVFGNLVEIDTIWGIQNTSFTHFQDPSNGPYQYSVSAFDSCYTTNIPPTHQTSAKADPHTTIYLQTTIDVCNRQLNLDWNDYEGFTVDRYRIFAKINSTSWQLLAETNSLFHSESIVLGDEYIIAIQAVATDGRKSFSNVDSIQTIGAINTSESFLSVATVAGNDRVEVTHSFNDGENILKVELEKLNNLFGGFEKIDEQTVGTNNQITFTDEDVEINRQSYTYRTKIIDTCGQPLGYSNIGKTILLKVMTKEDEEVHTLQWSAYEDFIGGLLNYEIYRSIDNGISFQLIATLPSNVRTYTDYVLDINQQNTGEICYYIQAVEGTNIFGGKNKSYSNQVCAYISPTIYIPNAFTVGGANPIFKPELRLIRVNDYSFEIFDRSGLVVFTTTDPNEGWNGRMRKSIIGKGSIAPEAVYVYRITVRDGHNIEHTKYGHVTLLRP